MDKVEISGFMAFSFGIILLVFTFFCAYGFLIGGVSILGSQNIVQTFDQAIAPLIEGIVRVLYLGVMGWIGSIPTIRGVQLLKKEKVDFARLPQLGANEKKKKTSEESKPEAKEIKPEEEKPVKVEEPISTKVDEPKKAEASEKPEELIAASPISIPTPAA